GQHQVKRAKSVAVLGISILVSGLVRPPDRSEAAVGARKAFNPLQPVRASGKPGTAESYGRLPLVFEPNRGQTDPQVRFLARASGYQAFLTDRGAVFVLRRNTANPALQRVRWDDAPSADSAPTAAVHMQFVGVSAQAPIEAIEPTGGISNYFLGADPSR